MVAILPNTELALIAFLASASVGAIWSLCSPDMGHIAILNRFKQIEPKLLIAQDGYKYAGKTIDRSGVIEFVRDGLKKLSSLSTLAGYPLMLQERQNLVILTDV